MELANDQNADLIVLLGDYVSQAARDPLLGDRNLKMPMHTIATDLAGLKAKYGVVAVMGNHAKAGTGAHRKAADQVL